MKYAIIFLILIGTAVLSFAESNSTVSLNSFMIKLHQTISVDTLDVEFLEIDDSRCPSDVTCVWEGRASVTLHIYNQTQYQTMILTTNTLTTYHVDSYEITLLDVLPYPISTKDMTEDYVAKISISKIPNDILSPLKQSKNGISSDMVNCKPALVLIIKNSDGSPACVKPETKTQLLQRGWATDVH